MTRRTTFRGDQGKAPAYVASQRDISFDDKTALVGELAARVLQSHFDNEGDDIRSTNDISMETHSRRRGFDGTNSASSESHIISSQASLQHMPPKGRGTIGGEMQA